MLIDNGTTFLTYEEMIKRYEKYGGTRAVFDRLLADGLPAHGQTMVKVCDDLELPIVYDDGTGSRAGRGTYVFDLAEVEAWELSRKCIGCKNGMPGCGLLPAYRDSLFNRKRQPWNLAGAWVGLVVTACYATVHPIIGLMAVSVFTVLLYDQIMRKKTGHT